MLQPIFDFIEKLATDFSWKRLVILLCLLFVVVLCLFIYEGQTATSQLTKYERSVAVLEKLELLQLNDKNLKAVAENIYQGLNTVTKVGENQISFINKFSTEAKQGFLAASPWLLIALFFLPAFLRRETEAGNMVGGLMCLAFFVGGIGYFLPTNRDAATYPIGVNLLILLMLLWYGNRKKSN